MAVDTANKRYSMMRLGQPVGLLPVPDGSIGVQDRAHFLGLYAGIALGAPVAFIPVFLGGRAATVQETGRAMSINTAGKRMVIQ